MAFILCLIFIAGANAVSQSYFSVSVTEEEMQQPTDTVFDKENPPISIQTESCAKGKYCYGSAEEFGRHCKSIQGGFTNGGRCFFRIKGPFNWDGAFSQCQYQGAELAQLHTADEFTEMTTFLRSRNVPAGEWHWIALKRMEAATGPYAIVLPTTWWYDTPTTRHSRLSAGNTWIRTHERDDGFAGSSVNCLTIFGYHDHIADEPCTKTQFSALCGLNNAAQTFNYVSKTCMAEVPIEEFEGITIEVCAANCSKVMWCRSFNYHASGRCQLYSMVLSDTINKDSKRGCFHYGYRR